MFFKFIFWLGLFWLYVREYETGYSTYFCELPCKRKHTVCKPGNCGKKKNCGPMFKIIPLTLVEINWFIDKFNTIRMNTAVGRNSDKTASNMRVMSYSRELEFVAQCWANFCMVEGKYDECRMTSFFGNVSQRVFYIPHNGDVSPGNILTEALHSAKYEEKYFSVSWIQNYTGFVYIPGSSYVQTIWAETYMVGCGRTEYGNKNLKTLLLVCNFAPSTIMFLGSPIFQVGKPCSECPEDVKCNTMYPGLCGEVRPLDMDDFIEPFAFSTALKMQISIILILCLIATTHLSSNVQIISSTF